MRGCKKRVLGAVVAAVLGFVSLPSHARADQVTDLLYAHSQGQLDRNNYYDATLNRADYWDCNGYSIRACQILLHFGYSCQIAVAGGHAFVLVSGKGISPSYYEPQLGGLLSSDYANISPTVYTLEQYVQHFSAQHCQMPMALPPASEEEQPAATNDQQVVLTDVQADASQATQGSGAGSGTQNTDPAQDEELGTEEWEHNGFRYRCKRGLTLIIMADGSLNCVSPQVAEELGATQR